MKPDNSFTKWKLCTHINDKYYKMYIWIFTPTFQLSFPLKRFEYIVICIDMKKNIISLKEMFAMINHNKLSQSKEEKWDYFDWIYQLIFPFSFPGVICPRKQNSPSSTSSSPHKNQIFAFLHLKDLPYFPNF